MIKQLWIICVCLKFLYEHGVDSYELKNVIDQHVSPADSFPLREIMHNNMRWQASYDSDNCSPLFRLANATIHCNRPNYENPPLETSSDGIQYCGGIKMEPNYCLEPTAGIWATNIPTPSTLLPRRFGIHRHHKLPRCKTIEEFVHGAYEGVGFDQEWVPKSCTAVPLSPFAWTQHTKCQATITMMVSLIISLIFIFGV
jgi:hypothetical protein